MKSLGLALTIFTLTAALAALDMSGAHRVEAANQDAAQPKAKVGAQRAVMSLIGSAKKVEADSEANPALIDAWLAGMLQAQFVDVASLPKAAVKAISSVCATADFIGKVS